MVYIEPEEPEIDSEADTEVDEEEFEGEDELPDLSASEEDSRDSPVAPVAKKAK